MSKNIGYLVKGHTGLNQSAFCGVP